MNIVTKSGTNDWRGSWFTLFRDDCDEREDRDRERVQRRPSKQDYRRYQYGGSFGGPIVRDKAHFFAAFERTQQDTFQVVNTQGLFPEFDGPSADAVPREPVHRQGHGQRDAVAVPRGPLRPQHQLAAVRRRAATRRRTTGARARTSSTRST